MVIVVVTVDVTVDVMVVESHLRYVSGQSKVPKINVVQREDSRLLHGPPVGYTQSTHKAYNNGSKHLRYPRGQILSSSSSNNAQAPTESAISFIFL